MKIFVDDQFLGTATVGGAWNNATRWSFDLPLASLTPGAHAMKVLAEDGIGGASLAGVQFRGETPVNVLSLSITAAR